MKIATILYRGASAVALLGALLTASSASASTPSTVSFTSCAQEVTVVSPDPLVLGFTAALIPGDGPGGKEGLEGRLTGSTSIKVKPNATNGEAILHGSYEFVGRAWEDGKPVWSGRLWLLEVGSGGPTDARGLWVTLDPNVHFVGRFETLGAAEILCAAHGYSMGGHLITGRLRITPPR